MEIRKLGQRRTAAQHDLEAPLHPAGEISQEFERAAAAQGAEPADPPWRADRAVRRLGVAGQNRRGFEIFVLDQLDRCRDLAERLEVIGDEGGRTGHQQLHVPGQKTFGGAQRLAQKIVAKHEAMNVETFIDDRNRRTESRLGPPRQRQHFQIARDDEIGPRHAAKLRAYRGRRLGDRREALAEPAVTRRAKVDRPQSLDIRNRIGRTTKAGQRDLGSTCPEHRDPPAHGRVGNVVHKVQDMQHENSTAVGPPTGMLVQLLLHRNIFGAAIDVFCCTAKLMP